MEQTDRVLKAVGAWLFLIVLSVAAAAVTIALVNKYQYGPETDVKAYFDALQAGDGAAALGALNAEVPDSNAALLDGEPLEAAAEKLDDVEISTVSSTSDQAVVRADYTLDGQEHSSEFTLHPADTQWGFFTVWDFDRTTLPTMHVTMAGSTSVDINGESVALTDSARDFAVFYPGIYTGSYTSPMVTAEPEQTLVTDPDAETDLTLDASPSDELKSQASEQIKTYLDTCAEQDTLYPAGCPFSYEFSGRVQDSVKWSIIEYPTTEIRLSGPNVDRWGLMDAPGTAKIEFISVNLLDGKTSQVSEEVPFTFKGTLEVTEEEATVTPRH
ncbi:MAG: hypothetical protein DI613_14030 [Kocuria rhizophila]|uniref:hypothetical protein n=1 Tax=Kocuria TaxID=57493 RepID=UPI000DB1BFBE|nr:hypothetical protein [Kocuria carniphila]MCT1802202.1 hypothetical protein [Kocuria carniphila]PZP27468.1 MAG: hypothetical protein DI613_14030 [Kocuria rhizophila]